MFTVETVACGRTRVRAHNEESELSQQPDTLNEMLSGLAARDSISRPADRIAPCTNEGASPSYVFGY